MDLKDVLKLIDRLEGSSLTYLLLEEDGKKIELKKDEGLEGVTAVAPKALANVPVATPPTVAPVAAAPAPVADAVVEEPSVDDGDFSYITSPIVGTFYASPSPTADAFVKVGDTVKKGQVLCIVEAMKLMNEIESEFAGEVVEVLVDNETMVEFGQKLFKVRV